MTPVAVIRGLLARSRSVNSVRLFCVRPRHEAVDHPLLAGLVEVDRQVNFAFVSLEIVLVVFAV